MRGGGGGGGGGEEKGSLSALGIQGHQGHHHVDSRDEGRARARCSWEPEQTCKTYSARAVRAACVAGHGRAGQKSLQPTGCFPASKRDGGSVEVQRKVSRIKQIDCGPGVHTTPTQPLAWVRGWMPDTSNRYPFPFHSESLLREDSLGVGREKILTAIEGVNIFMV